VRCDFCLPEGLSWVEVDEGQMAQVIRNLTLNAREAMPEGGTLSVRAANVTLGPQEVPPLPPGNYVRVSVADHGCGMAPDTVPRIFDPYFSTKQRGAQKGMGLGLTICHAILHKHQGAITVKSELGTGTTVDLYLPTAGETIGQDRNRPPCPACPPARILVMDDEEGVRDVVGMALRQLGHEVELVEDGQRAVEVYRSALGQGRPFGAVILDLTVRGGVGGRRAVQLLLEADPAVKAIVMSGYAHDPVLLAPERHGFKGVLTKPFNVRKLQEVLARLLAPVTGGQGSLLTDH
jgi:CheY-like chemotaxis protein